MPCIQNYRTLRNIEHNGTFHKFHSGNGNSCRGAASTLDKKGSGIDMRPGLLAFPRYSPAPRNSYNRLMADEPLVASIMHTIIVIIDDR